MTRKDYELMAATLRKARPDNPAPAVQTCHKVICYDLANALQAENPNFDRARFLRACGIEED